MYAGLMCFSLRQQGFTQTVVDLTVKSQEMAARMQLSTENSWLELLSTVFIFLFEGAKTAKQVKVFFCTGTIFGKQ